jgi:hypothetical protein
MEKGVPWHAFMQSLLSGYPFGASLPALLLMIGGCKPLGPALRERFLRAISAEAFSGFFASL